VSQAAPALEITAVRPEEAEALGGMTFPSYRHLLHLRAAPRHPEQGDDRVVQPLGMVARLDGRPVGLALAEAPVGAPADEPELPEVLSLFVQPDSRNRGVATALLEGLEAALAGRGFAEVKGTFMSGRAANDALVRVLAKRGWTPPAVRTVTLRFTPQGSRDTPWYGRLSYSSDYEIFPWGELTREEREGLYRTQAAGPWIPPGLEPWRHDRYGFDAVSSLGLRFKGQVVGWVINHRLGPSTVRFTCSFMRKDLGRRGRIMPLYTAALGRLEADGCQECLFITPVEFPNMVHFVKDRCAPYTGVLSETYGVSKRLQEGGR
jgi:GNAT superfamily N-acetyltransferase